jgi:phosphoglycolate phosphatase
MNKVIIFDLDGTLIDSRKDLTKGINLTREYYNLPPLDLKTVCGFIGNGARKLVERSFAGTGVDIDNALSRNKQFYLEHLADETKLYPEVMEGLQSLYNAGLKLAVITNKPDEAAKIILKKLDVDKYFDEIMGGGGIHPLKPEPGALLYFANKWKADFAESWMVGDHYTDMEAGKRAGMKRCWASYGFGSPRGMKYDFEAKSFSKFVFNVI